MRTLTYRVMRASATAILAALSLSMIMACHRTQRADSEETLTANQPSDDPAEETPPARTRSEEILFDAILAVCQQEGFEVATRSPKFYTVVTGYESVSARLRKRRIMRVILLPKGGALNVTVAYERDAGASGTPEWVPLEDAPTRERAATEELELAREIERKFHELRRKRR